MASTKAYLDYILEQLSGLDEISCRAMMPEADMELPYEGSKEMLLVDDVEDKQFLQKLLETMYEELPEPKRKKQ